VYLRGDAVLLYSVRHLPCPRLIVQRRLVARGKSCHQQTIDHQGVSPLLSRGTLICILERIAYEESISVGSDH
jgi:hypothetical protein